MNGKKHKVCMYLPPFAGDYSGVCSALFDLGGMICIHDAAGCTGNYTHFDEPRWYGSDSLVYCTCLRKVDAILGDDEKVINKIVRNALELKPKFVAIVGSPVPNVIGFDFNGVAKTIENRTGIPSFGFATAGIKGTYYDGIVLAYKTLSKYFEKYPNKRDPWNEHKTIGIPGISPLDMHQTVFDNLCGKLKSSGIPLLNDAGKYGNLMIYQHPTKIRMNLVWNQAGLLIAREMNRKYGTPYIEGFPTDDESFESYIRMIKEGKTGTFYADKPSRAQRHATVFADAVIGRSLIDQLYKENIDADLYTIEAESDQACFVDDEDKILDVIKREEDIVIADPLFLEYAENTATKIALPHYAVSSRVGNDSCFDYLDPDNWIDKLR